MAEEKVMELDEQAFKSEIENNDDLVLVDFWAPWCGPCKMISPIIEELAKEKGENVKFVKINIENNNTVANEYKIMSIPTIILFKQGKPVDKLVGVRTKLELENLIEKNL